MKTSRAVLAAACFWALVSVQAQEAVKLETVPTLSSIPTFLSTASFQARSTEEAVLLLQTIEALPLIPATEQPRGGMAGTYFSASRLSCPPVPGNFYGLDAWPLDDVGKIFLLNDFEAAAERQTMQMLGLEGPPLPGSGGSGTNGSGYGGWTSSPQIFGTNDLWLEDIGVSSNLALSYLVIHPPWNETNGMWDLFATTNLLGSVPGLNQTNWAWMLRTELWQTNLIVTNFSITDQCFFRLGTLLDSDNDGLTDAYENLVSHTNPNLWDTDGDGISDGDEVLLGTNPLLNFNDSGQAGQRFNYDYDSVGWLHVVSGVQSGSVTLDAEGNVLEVSQ